MPHSANHDLLQFMIWLKGHQVGWVINMHHADTSECLTHILQHARERNYGAERTNRLVDAALTHYGKAL